MGDAAKLLFFWQFPVSCMEPRTGSSVVYTGPSSPRFDPNIAERFLPSAGANCGQCTINAKEVHTPPSLTPTDGMENPRQPQVGNGRAQIFSLGQAQKEIGYHRMARLRSMEIRTIRRRSVHISTSLAQRKRPHVGFQMVQ